MAEKQLTVNDPVSDELFEQLVNLRDAKQQMALKLMDLEHEKIQILASSKRVDQQSKRLFEQILVERGLEPTAEAFIDANTRQLVPKEDVVTPKPEEAPPKPEVPEKPEEE
jgi:hypothetical protein